MLSEHHDVLHIYHEFRLRFVLYHQHLVLLRELIENDGLMLHQVQCIFDIRIKLLHQYIGILLEQVLALRYWQRLMNPLQLQLQQVYELHR